MDGDQWIVDGCGGRWMVDGGGSSVDGGQGRWTLDGGQWTVDGGRTVDYEWCIFGDCGQWMVHINA